MKNRPQFATLRQYAVDNGYAVAQVLAATEAQVAAIVGVRFTRVFLRNLRQAVAADLRHQADEGDRAWLVRAVQARFPDIVVERTREGAKPKLTVWPKGTPDG